MDGDVFAKRMISIKIGELKLEGLFSYIYIYILPR